MSLDEENTTINNDNSKKVFRDSDTKKRHDKRKDIPEGELIRRRKEGTKQRQEKLIDNLERKKVKTEVEHIDCKPNSKEKYKTVFETQKEDKLFQGRPYTISLALAGSILDNAQSAELRTYLAGQIARALSIFCVDEVIIFDDEHDKIVIDDHHDVTQQNADSNGCLQLARILQYLECPQYLRKHFFPIHRDLQYAGVLNPTDMPHHLRANEVSEFREGIILEATERSGSLVNIGLKKSCIIDKKLTAGIRVTVQLDLLNGKKIIHSSTKISLELVTMKSLTDTFLKLKLPYV